MEEIWRQRTSAIGWRLEVKLRERRWGEARPDSEELENSNQIATWAVLVTGLGESEFSSARC